MLVPIAAESSESMRELLERLYPICRSITGDGVRETLAIISERIDLTIEEVPSGTQVLDWTVPHEWNVRDAFIADASGTRVVDFRRSNLHLVSYSEPVHRRMSRSELLPHLHSLPDQPTVIPYRTSYYDRTWGFCLSHEQLLSLPDGEYEVHIDTSLEPGSLTYGELLVPGRLADEVLISAHVCHPSLCNDNLTGIAVATELADALTSGPEPLHSFRFLFAPGTIGAITWLDRNKHRAASIVAGLTLTCLGDEHGLTYKRTERSTTLIDRAAEHVLSHAGANHEVIDFFPYGYDERQFNSPGFRAPIGSLMRGRHGRFPEYHTSADDLAFVSDARLLESLVALNRILGVVDHNRFLHSTEPYGEPQLGARGLYQALGGTQLPDLQLAMLWVLNQSDGRRSLLDIADRAGLPFETIAETATILEQHDLLVESVTNLSENSMDDEI